MIQSIIWWPKSIDGTPGHWSLAWTEDDKSDRPVQPIEPMDAPVAPELEIGSGQVSAQADVGVLVSLSLLVRAGTTDAALGIVEELVRQLRGGA